MEYVEKQVLEKAIKEAYRREKISTGLDILFGKIIANVYGSIDTDEYPELYEILAPLYGRDFQSNLDLIIKKQVGPLLRKLVFDLLKTHANEHEFVFVDSLTDVPTKYSIEEETFQNPILKFDDGNDPYADVLNW